ncbi:hypothetical protein [Pseudomonas gingeri]
MPAIEAGENCIDLAIAIASKPAPTGLGPDMAYASDYPPCGSWLASDEAMKIAASLKDLIAGKSAPAGYALFSMTCFLG